MKIVSIVLGLALLIITGIILILLKSGAALKPAGVIGANVIGSEADRIPKALALRLFPEFHNAKYVIWHIDSEIAEQEGIPQRTHELYTHPTRPELVDLRKNQDDLCVNGCWYIHEAGEDLSSALKEQLASAKTAEIFIQTFRREEPVPEACEVQKILDNECVKHISVREVRRKFKSEEPHFFMRRYLDSRFFLLIETL